MSLTVKTPSGEEHSQKPYPVALSLYNTQPYLAIFCSICSRVQGLHVSQHSFDRRIYLQERPMWCMPCPQTHVPLLQRPCKLKVLPSLGSHPFSSG